MVEEAKNLIIGSGEAGKFLAWSLAKEGQSVLIVERSMVGGACPNVACLPSKNVVHSAKVASLVAHAASFGVLVGPAKVDIPAVIRRKRAMIDGLMELHAKNFHDTGAPLLMGEARFIAPRTVEIHSAEGASRTVRGERVFVAVGTRAALPPVPGLADARPLTHVEALELDHAPEHLVILGGGYVGLEFAQALRRFGSRVTIVQHGAQLLDREDPEFAAAVLQILRDDGIEVLLGCQVMAVAGRSGESLRIETQSSGVARTLQASDILVAAGRVPNTDRLDVQEAGIELDARGYVRVDDRLQSTAEGVWAMGDCAGSPHFTHVSFDDFRIVRDNLSGGSRTTRDRLIPYCLFTDPELAHVGLTETAARAQGISYRVLSMPAAAILRTRTHGEARGLVKALIGADDRLLGFTALAVEASELMTAVQVAMIGKLPYTALRAGIFAHPTTGEGLTSLFAMTPVEPLR